MSHPCLWAPALTLSEKCSAYMSYKRHYFIDCKSVSHSGDHRTIISPENYEIKQNKLPKLLIPGIQVILLLTSLILHTFFPLHFRIISLFLPFLSPNTYPFPWRLCIRPGSHRLSPIFLYLFAPTHYFLILLFPWNFKMFQMAISLTSFTILISQFFSFPFSRYYLPVPEFYLLENLPERLLL